MSALDFREIPPANSSKGDQDSFELFARDFLITIGYKVTNGPNRGPDGGCDLVALEVRAGVGGETQVRWLVSCKHKAHSGTSVTADDEQDIRDRISANHCDGFIGIYSTLPSAPLQSKLEGLKGENGFEYQIFDHEAIERRLLEAIDGHKLAGRYLPRSFEAWKGENPRPAKIFADFPRLFCEYCGTDITPEKGTKGLWEEGSGILVAWERRLEGGLRKTEHVYWCCKGNCDHVLKGKYSKAGLIDGWEDLPDLTIPLIYVKFVMAVINELHEGHQYSEDSLEKVKNLILALYPYVSRNATAAEEERIDGLLRIPEVLGGLG